MIGLTQEMIHERIDPLDILNQGFIPGILETNARFRRGEFYIPELLTSTMALKLGLNVLKPLIRERRNKPLGKVIIGTVRYDLHDIGKNLVIMVLETNGFDVIDLGVDVSPDRFVKAVKKQEAPILAMSCLLTTTMGWIKATVELLNRMGLKKEVRTLIGGAPVTPLFAREIGADAYCREATSTPDAVNRLLGIST